MDPKNTSNKIDDTSKSRSKHQTSMGSFVTKLQKTPDQKNESTKRKKDNVLLIDYEKQIKTPSQYSAIPPKKNICISSVANQCSKFLKMVDTNETISIPNQNTVAELSALQTELKILCSQKPTPHDFFRKAASLESRIKIIQPIVESAYADIILASDAYCSCAMGMKQCMETRNCAEGTDWEDLRNLLEKLGASKYLQDLE